MSCNRDFNAQWSWHFCSIWLLLLLLSRFSRVASVVCDPIDGSPPSSALLRILQARTLEWVAISFSNALKWKVKVKSLSRVWLFATPMDCSLPGFSVHGILQARVLERVAISFSSGSSWPRDPTQVSCIVGRCFYCLSHQGSQRLPLNGYTPIQHKKLKV